MSGYEPLIWEMATPLPSAGVITPTIEETPKAEETSTLAKNGGGMCLARALILALGVGVALIAKRRVSP